jgi:hypothetical protein
MTLELGATSLTEARLARGLTLEDAERGTRIARRFLIALEEHDYSVFPAPIYARGFLRSYSRYLGLDPEVQLAELPAGWAASPPASTYLPPVSRGPISLNLPWLVAGVLLVAIVGLGFYLSRTGGDLGQLQAQNEPAPAETAVAGNPGIAPTGQASQAPIDATSPAGLLESAEPGTLPDFLGIGVDEVTAYLDGQSIPYLRIDARSTATPPGFVIAQSPEPGTDTDGLERVTLTVSAGEDLGPTRTDCAVLEASNHRTIAEQAYLESSCGMPPADTADRTDCEQIRGTDYRSPQEREFFLANCIAP